MAPARMVSFIEQHAERCEICLQDPDLKEEIAKITEIVLPESKIPKAIRQKTEKAAQKTDDTEKVVPDDNTADKSNTDTKEGDDIDSKNDTPKSDPSDT